jgi:hypothetical protein
MIEASDVERKPFHPRICDPGAAAFSLRVRGADALAAQVRAEGGSMISRGGPIGDRPGGIFVRGPSGFGGPDRRTLMITAQQGVYKIHTLSQGPKGRAK